MPPVIEFSSSQTADVVDAAGNVLAQVCGTRTAITTDGNRNYGCVSTP